MSEKNKKLIVNTNQRNCKHKIETKETLGWTINQIKIGKEEHVDEVTIV